MGSKIRTTEAQPKKMVLIKKSEYNKKLPAHGDDIDLALEKRENEQVLDPTGSK